MRHAKIEKYNGGYMVMILHNGELVEATTFPQPTFYTALVAAKQRGAEMVEIDSIIDNFKTGNYINSNCLF